MRHSLHIIDAVLAENTPQAITAQGFAGFAQMMTERASYRNRRAQVLWSAAGLSAMRKQTGDSEYSRWIGHKLKRARELRAMELAMTETLTLEQALRNLNNAAYAAINAARDTVRHPDVERRTLRFIASETDRLVDALPAVQSRPMAEAAE